MIGVGDKVVVVDTRRANPKCPKGAYESPCGKPQKDAVYVVNSLRLTRCGTLRLLIVGKPCIRIRDGQDWGWLGWRFRKLKDHRNEQELEYLRKLPQPVLTTD